MLPKLKHMTDGDRQALDTQIQTVVAGLFNRTAALGKIAEETAGTSGVISTLFANKEEAFRARLLQEHRRAIVWLLQKRLMDVSLIQKRMQERLLKMKTQSQESFLYSSKSTPTSTLHKSPHSTSSTFLPFALSIPSTITSAVTATLSSTSSKLPKSTTAPSPAFPRSSTTSSPGRASTTSPARPSTTSLSPSRLASTTFSPGDEEDVRPQEEEDVAKSLTAQERMLLENDNVELLESLESSLDQVRHTTTLLMEISSLHSRLAHEVTQQATTIDTLYEESWRHTETVTKANVQLQSAQRRFAGARVWVLIFLVMASGVLGFLDYYG
ncbi:uncharacterized protein EV422DRAFT_28298 [Fimicolochytrium jonesii]|uniref:uncharacterized protein n=1 Tax=Fimicolochytrium jonesii TaxID=1396493 RepID=UPI0022FE9E15|nr:uncharacterized protein EV422DRAFT_28298 [Fimicolochytrium jonesii]KAI8827159.1 hypothetical protein EV422DRAFT_28298 [Fimicolochytrium jonesii]